MKLEEGLTKENFWNELYKAYPQGTQVFCEWIDEYKKACNWNDLFRDHLNADAKFSSPKFHDLPYDMQLGIWIRFRRDMGFYHVDDDLPENLRESITHVVKMIQED